MLITSGLNGSKMNNNVQNITTALTTSTVASSSSVPSESCEAAAAAAASGAMTTFGVVAGFTSSFSVGIGAADGSSEKVSMVDDHQNVPKTVLSSTNYIS